MDKNGESITGSVKFDTYLSIILNPDSYVQHGADPESDWTEDDIQDSVKNHYNSDRFLATVYPSSNLFFNLNVLLKLNNCFFSILFLHYFLNKSDGALHKEK